MCSFSQKGRNNIIEFDEDATLVYVEKSKQRSKDLFRCLLELKAINIGGDHVVQEYLFLCKFAEHCIMNYWPRANNEGYQGTSWKQRYCRVSSFKMQAHHYWPPILVYQTKTWAIFQWEDHPLGIICLQASWEPFELASISRIFVYILDI